MRNLKWALFFGGLACIPRVIRATSIALCGDGVVNCLRQVATSNVNDPEAWSTLTSVALHDRYLVDLDSAAWLLAAGVVAIVLCQHKTHRSSAHMAIASTIGVLLIGILIGYIRSYHLRIVAVPVAVAAALGLSRAWPIAVISCGAFIWTTHALLPVGPDPNALARQDQIAAQLPKHPIWVDQVWWDGLPRLDPSAVVLSGWLSGYRNFELNNTIPFVLLENSTAGVGWRVRQFPNVEQTRLWFDQQRRVPHQRGGAYDWATISNPNTKLEDARW